MSRAPAMAPSDRRQAIIAVTLPLLEKLGANVTTSQIAHAAGIAEGTIFRVFEDKRELLMTAAREAMSGEHEIERIQQIPPQLPLAERLAAALRVLSGYQDRMVALMRLFREADIRLEHEHSSLMVVRKREGAEDGAKHHLLSHPAEGLLTAIAGLIDADRGQLRLEPRRAAQMLLALSFSNRVHDVALGEPSAEPEELVDLFLNGALKH